MHAKICLAEMQKHLTEQNKSINDSFILPVIDVQHPITTFDKNVLLATIIRNFSSLPTLYNDSDWFYDDCAMWWDQYKYNFANMWMTNELKYNPINNYNRHEEETITPGVTETERHAGTDRQSHTGSDINTAGGSDTDTKNGHDDFERQGKTISDVDTLERAKDIKETKVSAMGNNNGYQPKEHITSQKEYLINGEVVPDNIHSEISHLNDKDVQTYDSSITTAYGKIDTLQHGEIITDEHGHVITHEKNGNDNRVLNITGATGNLSTQHMMRQEYNIRKFNLYTYIANCFADNMCLGIW